MYTHSGAQMSGFVKGEAAGLVEEGQTSVRLRFTESGSQNYKVAAQDVGYEGTITRTFCNHDRDKVGRSALIRVRTVRHKQRIRRKAIAVQGLARKCVGIKARTGLGARRFDARRGNKVAVDFVADFIGHFGSRVDQVAVLSVAVAVAERLDIALVRIANSETLQITRRQTIGRTLSSPVRMGAASEHRQQEQNVRKLHAGYLACSLVVSWMIVSVTTEQQSGTIIQNYASS